MNQQNKLRITFLGLVISAVFMSFTHGDNPPSKFETILKSVGIMLEQGHYSPKQINDKLSKEIFEEYIKRLDPSKWILLEKDISKLRKFDTEIDDEIHGKPLDFFYAAEEVYKKRIEETEEIYKSLIDKPVDFTKDESVEMDNDKMAFASNDNDRKERWRKHIKFRILEKYADLLEQQEKNKDKKDFVAKSNEALQAEARTAVKKNLDRYFERLRTKFDENQRFSVYVNSLTNLMDPHTDFFPPVEKRSFDERLSGRFYGIGALLSYENDKVRIKSVTAGGPAWKSGEIKDGDYIVKVAQGDGEAEDIVGYSTDEAVKLIRGAEGTNVRIWVEKPDGTVKMVSLIRQELKLDETFARSVIINGKHKIGVIDLPSFYADFQRPTAARCSKDVAKEVEKLKAEGVDAIVMDIRGNGGGSLNEVVNMVGLFIKTGPVVQVRDRAGRSSAMGDNDPSVLYDGPLAVLVDERSASASEIFAAAIQDHKRGVVIGSTNTFGKGTVQRAFPIGGNGTGSGAGDLGSVHLTLQKYYRINGGSVQLKGVTPDIVLSGLYENYKFQEKDSPSALPWDEIQKSPYLTWENQADLSLLKQKTFERLSQDNVFAKIKDKTTWQAENRKMARSLQLDKYKSQIKEIRDVSKQVSDLVKLKNDLAVANLKIDLETINGDSLRKERNKFWVDYLKKDIYLSETLNVVNDMIEQKGMAMKKD
ncbi:MAG: carboxy terminal-processing peptidase [Spirosomaceae bacterium]|nr:carboxy terminal-processing peptidase [Spirosomataceae bacterium]